MAEERPMDRTLDPAAQLRRRITKLEEFRERTLELQADMKLELVEIRHSIEKGFEKMDSRIKVHDDSRATRWKILTTVLAAVAITLIGWLVKISFMVQGAKVP
jgi:t-SNARE complex subunit (syntaxin)